MLAKIREKTQGIIATFILALVGIPFILWGIGSYFDKGGSIAVAKVNGVEISQQMYRQRLETFRRGNPQIGDNPAIKNLIVESLIDEMLLVANADDGGYRVGDKQLAQIIETAAPFQSGGRFAPTLYQAWLRNQNLSSSQHEVRLRQNIVTSQREQGLSESAFVTEADLAAMVRLLKQERRVSYVIIDADSLQAKIGVSGQEIDDYYQANQELFRSAESVRVEYLALKVSDVGQQVQPTDEELRQAYNASAARYVIPEKRKASHLLVTLPIDAKEEDDKTARARIDGLAKQLRAGADFAALAKKNSDDKDSAAKGGDLGEVSAGFLPAELEAALNALKPNQISEPVRTTYGYHLIKLTSYQPEQRRSYETVKKELIEQVRQRKGEERFYELAERFRNLVYEHPESLQPAAKDLGLTVQTSDWFTRSGGPGIAAQPRVAAAAFEPDVLSRQRNTDAIELNAETLVALHVIEHRPSVVRPLTDVRPAIERALKEQRSRDQARTLAEEWSKKLEQGAKLGELARAANVTVQSGKMLTREQTAGTDKRIVDAVFAAARPKDQPVVGQVDLARQGYAVFALEAVTDADPAKADAALKEKVRRQLAQRRGADYYASYRAGLRKAASVKINADQL